MLVVQAKFFKAYTYTVAAVACSDCDHKNLFLKMY
jgi:hypothetical protein